MDLHSQLHPYDYFRINCPKLITNEQQTVLQLCYQPIIGKDATSLYLKLWAELQIHDDQYVFPHHYLLDSLGGSIKELLEARVTLEAIGLLDTYAKKADSHQQFIYKLIPPLGAVEFFNESILTIALIRKIGKQAFGELRSKFIKEDMEIVGYKKVSRHFTEVFTVLSEEDYATLQQLETTFEPATQTKNGIPFEYEQFDFKFFMQGINKAIVPERLFTNDIKMAIAKLAFMYNYSPIDMQKIVMWSLGEDDTLSKVRLEQKAEEYFTFSGTKRAPSLMKAFEVAVDEDDKHQQRLTDISSKDGLIQYLNNTSPIQVFKDLNKVLPTESIVLTINNYVRKGYSYGVINALIHYISLNKQLSYSTNLMDAIMSSWIKESVVNAEQAMEIAAKQYNLRRQDGKKIFDSQIKKEDLYLANKQFDAEYVDYETSSTFEFLKILTKGSTPVKRHVELADRLVQSYGIPIGVTNVIIEKAWQMSNGALPENLVETMASEYREQGFVTAKEALAYAGKVKQMFKPKIMAVPPMDVSVALSYDQQTPYEFLKKLYDGKEPVKFIVDLAESLVLQQNMPIGVVNVLMEHAMNEGALNKNYIQAVAANWMKENFVNAKEALAFMEQQQNPVATSKITLDTIFAFRAKQKDLSKWLPAYDEKLPYEFIKEVMKKEPTAYIVQLAEDLVLKTKISVGVVNVIFEYVLTKDHGRFNKNNVQTIATNMQLQNIELAQDALAYIEMYYVKQSVQIKITETNLKSFYAKGYLFTSEYEKYEGVTPYEFIKQLNNGIEPFPQTVYIAEKLVLQRKIAPSIVNFLLEYVMENTDGALPEKYIQTVAQSWLAANVQTIDEAKKYIAEREKSRNARLGKKVSVVPKWLKENTKKEKSDLTQTEASTQESIDDDEIRRQLLKELDMLEGE